MTKYIPIGKYSIIEGWNISTETGGIDGGTLLIEGCDG